LVALVPASAGVRPDCVLHEVVLPRDEVIDGFTLGRYAMDVRCLISVDDCEHVVSLGFDGAKHWAIADWTVGSQLDHLVSKHIILTGVITYEDKVVGEASSSNA
jgi:hypothetical protein